MQPHPNDPKGAAGALKTPLQLIPTHSEALVAHVFRHGAGKYGPWNWRENGICIMTYAGAIKRHLAAVIEGEDIDPESGLPHMAHIASSAMIVMDAGNHGTLVDDRPPRPGKPVAGRWDRLHPARLSAASAEPPRNVISFTGGTVPPAVDPPPPAV